MSRITELFAMRLARRRGETRPDEEASIAELDSYGENLGIARSAGAAQAAAPAMPDAQPSAPAMPAMPAMPDQPATAAEPATPMQPPGGGDAASVPPRAGIPALDALSEMPKRRHRGIVHDRTLGRVLPASGGMGG